MRKRTRTSLSVFAACAIGPALLIGCSKPETEIASAAPSSEASASSRSAPSALPSAPSSSIKVYKNPNCGCCNNWVDHLREYGFTVETVDMPDVSMVKQKHGVTRELESCHTAVVGDYAIEGHVPADLIQKLLKEKPSIAGLAVPGMPMGSPGMEGATKDAYDVLTFDRAGKTTVYAQR